MRKIIVIGVGNILFHDEGAGVYAAAYLKANFTFTPSLEIIDGGTLGIGLSTYLMDYDDVVICDTLSIDDNAGSIYCLNDEALSGLGETAQSVHEIEVTQMLETCRLAGACACVHIVGVVPEDIQSVAFGLSTSVKSSFAQMVETIIALLGEKGVDVQKREQNTSLLQIIDGYASAKAAR